MDKEHQRAHPSKVIWKDLNHVKWEEMNFPWEEMEGSDNFESIRYILDRRNRTRRDALHIDSAYKTKCNAFLSRDQHILAKAQELEKLLGIRFFHPDDHWDEFLAYVGARMEGFISP